MSRFLSVIFLLPAVLFCMPCMLLWPVLICGVNGWLIYRIMRTSPGSNPVQVPARSHFLRALQPERTTAATWQLALAFGLINMGLDTDVIFAWIGSDWFNLIPQVVTRLTDRASLQNELKTIIPCMVAVPLIFCNWWLTFRLMAWHSGIGFPKTSAVVGCTLWSVALFLFFAEVRMFIDGSWMG